MFDKDEYFDEMILKLEDTFSLLYKVGILSVFLIGMMKFVLSPNDLFVLYDVILLLVLIVILIKGPSISMKRKVIYTCSILAFSGLFSYLVYGIEGTGFGVLFIANITAGIFASRKYFNWIFLTSILGLSVIMAYRELHIVIHHSPLSIYFFQMVMLIICIQVLRIAVYALRNSLVENIVELDNKLEENKFILHELKQQNLEIKVNEEEIYQLAYYDQLTGLPMKNLFKRNVEERLSIVENATMLLVDIKDFKLLNSVYGSQIGDELLKIAGDVINTIDSPLLYACRISGNDFGFWYESNDIALIEKHLNQLLLEFNVRARKIFMYNKVQFYMSYVQYPCDGESYIDLYNKAVIALNYSKASKKAELLQFTHEMESALHEENHLKDLIEDAIQRRAFDVSYQEQYDSINNRVIGIEALARWHSEELGHVSPVEFIPIITKYQLIGSFERLIIGKVFSDYPRIIEKYGEVSIGINISPEHIILPQFVKYFEDAILLYRINPSLITLEITEEVIINGMDKVRSILDRLKNIGLKISLDDFGTGYSSLNYLSKIPFDEIKIDKTFIDEIEDKRVQTILKAVIEIKKSYNIQVIAEGVETTSQLKILQELGCPLIQGYLFSKPKPLKELEL
ncbi:MAG: EAL domain-containing protein [Clostridiales bacterium]|nr:EAL domain-containing protein [Clostridiales bacterium]